MNAPDALDKLIPLLACPDCGDRLNRSRGGLRCASCYREFEARDGIPLLYPADMDLSHLREEENLARMMKSPKPSPKERFIAAQWRDAKDEFWSMVRERRGSAAAAIVNIGCGYDRGFDSVRRDGDLVVNFDMVYDMLLEVRDDARGVFSVGGDLNRLPFKPGAFDAAVSVDVIHHESDDLPRLLGSFRDLLKPGGRLFLEDPNAWGLFQIPRSILLPRPVYRVLRSAYHRARRSEHRPADYEFPTDVRRVVSLLEDLGFREIAVHPHTAYPNVGRLRYGLYRALGRSERVRKYHNYHYMLSAVRG